ncbi:FUSC family protein [Clostridium sardiniense]|uniref:FUSC family protein n=1 Tax=Clostridium sardiniense TaxID=29369 RepID=UPI003D32FB60
MKTLLKSTIFLKTIIYFLGLIVFFSYWHIFGVCNACVGVTVVKGSITLLNKDLTGNPIKNSITFLIVFLYIGLFSYLAALNIYIGLFINFFTLFILTYNFVSNLNQSIWIPFVFGYLYLLVKPVSYTELPKRLIALGIGSFFIIITQYILNRNSSKDKIKKNLLLLVDAISDKINYLIDGKDLTNKKFNVLDYIHNIITAIYNRRTSYFYIDEQDSILLNLSLYIENLNYSIRNIEPNDINIESKKFLKDLYILIGNLTNFIESKKSSSLLINEIDKFINVYKESFKNNYTFFNIIENLRLLKFSLNNLSYYNLTDYKDRLNPFKRIKSSLKLNFNKNSLKFTYAFKLSFLLSISYFLVEFFNIPQGKWITFTIFSLVQPYIETSQKRFGGRFKGTVLGIILFSIIDILLPYTTIKILIFIILYYIFTISKDYTLKMLCTTTVGIGVFSMITSAPAKGDFYRFIFMAIGTFIAYLGTKYIFPYSLKDALKRLTKSYYLLGIDMIKDILNDNINIDLAYKFNEKLMISKLYESKIIINNSTINLNEINKFLYNQRALNNDIYFIFFSIFNNEINKCDLLTLRNNVTLIINDTSISSNDKYLSLDSIDTTKDFESIKDSEEKLIYITIYRIIKRLKISNGLINDLNNIFNKK